jgi:lincosamide nucleotidyltransferase A/C/D/E
MESEMTALDVLRLYQELEGRGIPIWIDGGWCVDALLGRQTRAHPDLDIAVERKFAAQLEQLLLSWGYQRRNGDQASAWNYSMEQQGRVVDVHVFEFDENGKNVYGVQYPFGSLNGEGVILHSKVRCVGPEWMFKFKTAYTPTEKDLQDVQALAAKYGFEIPATHRQPGQP